MAERAFRKRGSEIPPADMPTEGRDVPSIEGLLAQVDNRPLREQIRREIGRMAGLPAATGASAVTDVAPRPRIQREYLLTYAGKQSEAEILLETAAFPFQRMRAFGEPGADEWHNTLIFGDNLPALRRLAEMKAAGAIVNADGSEGIRCVYIDPPFASEDDYETKDKAIAYSDKVRGADFIEGLRRRLVVIREVLADQASIFVHLDWRKSHYIKAVMDEIFGEHNFVNEIVWCYTGPSKVVAHFPRKHDVILFYRVGAPIFNLDDVRIPYKEGSFTMGGQGALAAKNRAGDYKTGAAEQLAKGKIVEDHWSDIPSLSVSAERTGFPTQKPERLAARIIKATTRPGDIVLDCFAGSGTALVAAEKLDRRWIGVELGLNGLYQTQKRLLNVASGKALAGPETVKRAKGSYGKAPRPFTVYSCGHYDYHQLKSLPFDQYRSFVLRLFGATEAPSTINGVPVDGRHRGDPVIVYDFNVDDAPVTVEYLDEMASYLEGRVTNRVLFVAPAKSLAFLEDRIAARGIEFEVRRVPYSAVAALQKRAHQPASKEDINKIIETESFDFAIPPEAEWEIDATGSSATLRRFRSRAIVKSLTEENRGYPSVAMVLVDYDHDGEVFDLDEVFFAESLAGAEWTLKLEGASRGQAIAISICDRWGNEHVEVLRDVDWGGS